MCGPVDLLFTLTFLICCSQVNIAAPAGAIISTGRDMSRWMMWHLAGGAVPPYAAEDSLIDKDSLWETYRGRNTAFSWHFSSELTTTSNMSTQHVAYGLGWITSYYRGLYTTLCKVYFALVLFTYNRLQWCAFFGQQIVHIV